jgi:hypothetical protein
MVRKNTLQVSLLSMFVLFLTAWAGAQSAQEAAKPFPPTGSSSAAPTEQQEMRDESKALRAQVAEVEVEDEQDGNTRTAADRGQSLTEQGPIGPVQAGSLHCSSSTSI